VSNGPDRHVPIGVRPADLANGRLRWVRPAGFVLSVSDRVVVGEDGADWYGELLVASDRLVEWVSQDGLPVVTRLADPGSWPARPIRAGRQLLESLGLPPELIDAGAARLAAGVAGSGPEAVEAAEDERGDQ
jgi:hypothetical protein